MFGMTKRGKNPDADPTGGQTDLSIPPDAIDPNAPFTMRPEEPFAVHYRYLHNNGLTNFRAFNYGETPLPGRLYSAKLPMHYGKTASELDAQ